MNEFLDIFMEAGVDTLKLIPFLFLTYILMEWLEHRTGSHTQAAILRAGKAGPVFGGILGIVPGYSAGTKGNATGCSQRHLSRTKYTGIKTDAGR